MKNIIAIFLAFCSLSVFGYERMDFDWEKIPGVDGVAIDRLNSSISSSGRKYWIRTYSLILLRETDCEKLESKILRGNGYSRPKSISLINGAMQPAPLLLPFRSEFMVAPMEVVDNDKAIASFACSL
jgi:hypothetical protein